jgi:flagellar hook-associated protein 1 FlgK
VGNNIANVNTVGYTRQRVDLNSVANGGYIQRYKPQDVTAGGGVTAKGVSRVRDSFLDTRYRMQNSTDNQYAAILSGLNDLENVVDQTTWTGLLNEIGLFKNALSDTMLANPASGDMAMVVRNSAQKISSLLNTYSSLIDNVRNQQIYDLQTVSIDTDFNSIVRNIASLDRQINEQLAHGNTPNELYDERDLLFDRLSGLANVRITIEPKPLSDTLSVERVRISIVDDSTGKSIDLVDDEAYNTLTATLNPDGTLRVDVNSAFGNIGLKDVTQYLTGGAIGGSLNVINGKGTEFGAYAYGDNTFRGTLYYKGMLDTFAANFARVFNDLNEYDPGNITGNNERRDLFGTIDGASIVTAANIRVSQNWYDDPMYLTVTQPGDQSPGENIGRMVVAIDSGVNFYKNGNSALPPMYANMTFEEFFTGVNATLGLDVSLYTNYSTTSLQVMNTLFTARESVSGVSLEEEGTYLMAYEKSYNAAVRYFTVLDECITRIIDQMGLAGR